MNKEYLKWLRELKNESFFVAFGVSFSYHRKDFLNGITPSDSAFNCVPW